MDYINSNRIFSISDFQEFEAISLEVFNYQVQHCEVYGRFVANLGINLDLVKDHKSIPYLPIEFFKSQKISCGPPLADQIFSSSGTSGMAQSQHLVKDISVYMESYRKAFQLFYGDISKYAILALLPSYQEREGSSLIYMVDDFIGLSNQLKSGYFLYNYQALQLTLTELKESKIPTILIGVSHALLDFAESHCIEFPELIVMETGGMKGKRKEILRTELHAILCQGFRVPVIHSEYGMTELLSQAYAIKDGVFKCPPWMKVMVAEEEDPTSIKETGRGVLHIIDLANIYSCCFIATEDIGEVFEDGSFTVLGRLDASARRGCSLLVV